MINDYHSILILQFIPNIYLFYSHQFLNLLYFLLSNMSLLISYFFSYITEALLRHHYQGNSLSKTSKSSTSSRAKEPSDKAKNGRALLTSSLALLFQAIHWPSNSCTNSPLLSYLIESIDAQCCQYKSSS
jgi:hypothetical protein